MCTSDTCLSDHRSPYHSCDAQEIARKNCEEGEALKRGRVGGGMPGGDGIGVDLATSPWVA